MHSEKRTRLVTITCIFLVLAVIALGATTIALQRRITFQENEIQKNQFHLLSPSIAWLSVDEFLEQQQKLSTSLSDLKVLIDEDIGGEVKGKYGVYVEDLNTGAWTGINERDKFIPASLLKIPVMIAVLKKVEQGNISLQQKVVIAPEDINLDFGSLGYMGAGYSQTVQELLTSTIIYSDNTAVNALRRSFVTDGEYVETAIALGIPTPLGNLEVSPKEYSNSLRALYYSTQLRRPLSEAAISILLKTNTRTQLPAKLPPEVKIAHKIGIAYENEAKTTGSYHDCGIVYLPKKPYIICVMSSGTTQEEADRVISTVSKTVYDYMSK